MRKGDKSKGPRPLRGRQDQYPNCFTKEFLTFVLGLLLGLLVLWETVTLMEGTITQKINRCWENPDKDQEPSKRTCHMLALQRIRPVLPWHK